MTAGGCRPRRSGSGRHARSGRAPSRARRSPSRGGWYADNAGAGKQEVCTQDPNAWGLCDLSGNVWEFVHDKREPYAWAQDGAPVVDLIVDDIDGERVRKGGTWDTPLADLRIATRSTTPSDAGSDTTGFRLVRSVHRNPRLVVSQATQPEISEVAGVIQCTAPETPTGDLQRIVLLQNGRPTRFEDVSTEDLVLSSTSLEPGPGDVWTCRVYREDGVGGTSWQERTLSLELAPGDGRFEVPGDLPYIPSGRFSAGCVEGRDDKTRACREDELPAHEVTLTRGFWMARSETLASAFASFMWYNPGFYTNPPGGPDGMCEGDCPIEDLNWWETLRFANEASLRAGLPVCYDLSNCSGVPGTDFACASVGVNAPNGDVLSCEGYRLPTSAEWEHAARAWSNFEFAGSDNPDLVAWYGLNNDPFGTKPVCQLQTNDFDLCDMTGNVKEWTWSWYAFYEDDLPDVDPVGPPSGEFKVTRGADSNSNRVFAQLSGRGDDLPSRTSRDIGFRLVRTSFAAPSNGAPETPVVSVTRRASSWACSAASAPQDPDGDDVWVRVHWLLNGRPTVLQDVSVGGGPTVELPDDRTAPGDAWTCEITVTDGLGGLSSAQETRFIDGVPGVDDLFTGFLGDALWLPGGRYTRGCIIERDGVGDPRTCRSDETPVREVQITRGLWAMQTELTRPMFSRLMGYDPSPTSWCEDCPVGLITFFEAAAVANAASEAMGLPACYTLTGCGTAAPDGANSCTGVDVDSPGALACEGWRLPTESEWEWMAREFDDFAYAGGGVFSDVAWTFEAGLPSPQEACTAVVPMNDFGLCDLSGNVNEWVWDMYDAYPAGPLLVDPVGPDDGSLEPDRMLRGGSVDDAAVLARNAARNWLPPRSTALTTGVRLVRTAPTPTGNSSPPAPAVSLVIDGAGDVVCDVGPTPIDPDGDTVTLRGVLLKAGTPTRFQQNTAAGSVSLVAQQALTTQGETWSCVGTASDGLGGISETVQTVTIP